MSRTSDEERDDMALLKYADTAFLTRPLWTFPPAVRSAVLHERARRGYNPDPEPTGDAEYS